MNLNCCRPNPLPSNPRYACSKAMPDPEQLEAAEDPGELAPEDFYFDGPYLVFTAAYHLKRGFCCNSDCRHCPYK